jgi:hypothetical protein
MGKHRLLMAGASLLALVLLLGCDGAIDGPTDSTDASLSLLIVTDGVISPALSDSSSTYTATVANETASAAVVASVNATGAAISATKDGNPYSIGQLTPLEVGSTVFVLTVTAPDGRSTRVYTLTVARPARTLSSDSTLSSLSVDSVPVTLVSGVTAYQRVVPRQNSSVTVGAAASSSHAALTIDGAPTDSVSLFTKTVALDSDSTDILIEVTAEDGTRSTYTLIIEKAEAGNLSVGVTLNSYEELVFSGQGSTMGKGDTWTVVPSVSGASYRWYMDGLEMSSASSLVISGSSLEYGHHSLGLSAQLDKVIYYAALEFLVLDEPAETPASIMVSVSVPSPGDLIFSAATDSIGPGQSLVFAPELAGATSYEWHLDGELVSSGGTYTAYADSLGPGPHIIFATASVGGLIYSGTFSFNVQNSSGAGGLNIIVELGQEEDLGFAGAGAVLRPGQTWNLVPSFASATSYAWYLDLVLLASTSTLSLDSSGKTPGHHDLALITTVDGREYSGQFGFDIVDR